MEKRTYLDDCPLKGSRTCRLLHMGACDICPGRDPEGRAALEATVRGFDARVDGPAVASLFESETCSLCKGEQKEKRNGYALWDMGFPAEAPAGKKKFSLFGPQVPRWEYLLPLQFACCRRCRRRVLLTGYLSMLGLILGLGIALLLAGVEHFAQPLRALWRGLPLTLTLVLALAGYGTGKLLSRKLQKRFSRNMYIDPEEHPVVRALLERGWLPMGKAGAQRMIFTRKRLHRGLGTAPSKAYAFREEEQV